MLKANFPNNVTTGTSDVAGTVQVWECGGVPEKKREKKMSQSAIVDIVAQSNCIPAQHGDFVESSAHVSFYTSVIQYRSHSHFIANLLFFNSSP